ncbi:unnamed protein product [Calypogeia fissa]
MKAPNIVHFQSIFWSTPCRGLESRTRLLPSTESNLRVVDADVHEDKSVDTMVKLLPAADRQTRLQGRDWAKLVPEILTEVFQMLPFEDRLKVVPLVCKSWNEASWNPQCWTVVDMEPWLKRKTSEDSWWGFDFENHFKATHLIKVVLGRSCGQIRHLRTMALAQSAADSMARRYPNTRFTYCDQVQGHVANPMECRYFQEIDIPT